MVLYCQFPVGLLYLAGGGRLSHSQELVEVTSGWRVVGVREGGREDGREGGSEGGREGGGATREGG